MAVKIKDMEICSDDIMGDFDGDKFLSRGKLFNNGKTKEKRLKKLKNRAKSKLAKKSRKGNR